MMEDVSLVVSSLDSKGIYPNNKPHDFTINLKPQYSLEGQWKVGVREISHSANVVNIQSKGEPNTISFTWLDEGERAWGEKTIHLAADASFLTPQDLIKYINESFTILPRRPEPVVTTYRVEELVTIEGRRLNIRRKDQNAQAMRDIPIVIIHKRITGRQRHGFLVMGAFFYPSVLGTGVFCGMTTMTTTMIPLFKYATECTSA